MMFSIMKKKLWISIATTAVLLAILFVPIPTGIYKDGGTREYAALTYKIVHWKRLYETDIYEKTVVYGPMDRWKSIDALWSMESAKFGNRNKIFSEEWLEKSDRTKTDNELIKDIRITEIYQNCFFASPVIPMPYQIKLNGTLSSEWCIGDQISVTYDNLYYDEQTHRIEADLLTVSPSDFHLEPNVCYKPVIYLYPNETRTVSVKLTLDGDLTCTYPTYNNGWTVTASPDGTLTDANGQTYNYLYWEGETFAQYDMTKGFCIKGEDTAAFLEEALTLLGLTRREANEFIVYWLPLMQENPYNVISFQTELYTNASKLEVTPAPDTLIRVFMAYKPSDIDIPLEAQTLTAPKREGFTVVEWGGTMVK